MNGGQVLDRSARVLVLDDDPTGTQSATGVTVLFEPDIDLIATVLECEHSAYLQTNSRALDEATAVTLSRRIRSAVEEVARRLDLEVRVVLRGDSTLRGHVFSETAEFIDEDGVVLFVPAFPEGGRVTRDGIHWVRVGDAFEPVASTEYARDTVFAFDTSDLVDFAVSRSGRAAELVGLDDLRSGGLGAALLGAAAGTVIVADAETDDDIGLIATAVEAAWSFRTVVVRSAAPLAAALAGVRSTGRFERSDLPPAGRVLVVCGSHTDGARAQLKALARTTGEPTVVDTANAIENPHREGARVAAVEQDLRRPGGVAVIATERQRSSDRGSLEDGARVMSALIAATTELAVHADTVITKGGITSAEVMGSGLGALRARVLGQWRSGVSVWKVRAADGRDIPCIIVPGNMGDDDVLTAALAWASA